MDDIEYLKMAYSVARRSKDPSTQNGSLLVDPVTNHVLVHGWNDIHSPIIDTVERRSARPDKYHFTEHAERCSILAAARHGIKTKGLWMYCPWSACHDCGRAIVYAGIKRLVTHDIPQHYSRPDWKASIDASDQMFKEAGVEIVRIKAHLGVRFRFNGEEIEV